MRSCGLWHLRVLLVALVYLVAIYTIYEAISRFQPVPRPGVESLVAIVFYHSILIIATLASTVFILYVTGSLLTTSTLPLGYLMLALESPFRLILLVDLAVASLIAFFVMLALQLRGRLGEPVLDLAVRPKLSPTALASASISMYIVWSLATPIRAGCEVQAVYAATSTLAAVTAALASYNVLESIALGLVAGLGPLGLAVNLSYAMFKPLKPPTCTGVEVGALQGFTTMASPTRSIMGVRTGPRASIIACSTRSKAILELEEPWILWVYGLESRSVAYKIAERLGGGLVVRLGAPGAPIAEVERRVREAVETALKGSIAEVSLGGIEPAELRLALIPTIAETATRTRVLAIDIDIPQSSDSLLKIAYEVSRKHPRVIVILQDIPWKEAMLAPRGPAKSSGFIVTKLGDPAQADNVSRILAPRQAEGLRELIERGEAVVAYPGCGGNTIVVEVEKRIR